MGLRAWSHDDSIAKSNLPFKHVKLARDVLLQQSRAVERVGKNIPADFSIAVDLILRCQTAVIVMGMGKAGWIGQKVSASLASTGTPSHFLHPAEAIHGDNVKRLYKAGQNLDAGTPQCLCGSVSGSTDIDSV